MYDSETDPESTMVIVEFVHDKDFYKYARTSYTFMDLLRDVGGLLGALNGVFSSIIFILNFNGLYWWLTSQLFRV